MVARTARDVTAGSLTDYERAVALQQWFREDGGFRYSLDDAPPGKVGADQLAAFLDARSGRVGYCEQFAAAMAVMARTLDIPARVAVGFLTPDRVEGDTWVYSAYDLHAWPELYFPGAGWVLFDPTPGDRVPDAALPAYSTRGSEVDLPTVSPDSEPSASQSAGPDREPQQPTTAPQDATDENAAAESDGGGVPWRLVLLVLVTLLLLAAVVVGPRLLRGRQRARRVLGGPEAAWEELRATVLDLRQQWPGSRSPREVEAILVRRLGRTDDEDERPQHGAQRNPEAAESLTRIAREVERGRYARAGVGRGAEPGALHDDVLTCTAALEAGSSPHGRRLARWLPVSAFRRRRTTGGDAAPLPEPALAGNVVDHI